MVLSQLHINTNNLHLLHAGAYPSLQPLVLSA